MLYGKYSKDENSTWFILLRTRAKDEDYVKSWHIVQLRRE